MREGAVAELGDKELAENGGVPQFDLHRWGKKKSWLTDHRWQSLPFSQIPRKESFL